MTNKWHEEFTELQKELDFVFATQAVTNTKPKQTQKSEIPTTTLARQPKSAEINNTNTPNVSTSKLQHQ